MSDRRDFFKKIGLLGLTGIATKLVSNEQLQALEMLGNEGLQDAPFALPVLPYAYNALEPFIDEQTMKIHHTKHHQAYVDKLNKTIENLGGKFNLEESFKTISKGDVVIRNNGGGHYNHSLFWQLMKPNPESKENKPIAKLADAILRDFKSFDDFKKEFSEKATKIFGSGWCWLIEQDGKLKITTTANQDNPLMDVVAERGKPILALDVWEHAYYLKYQNKRADYIANWWNVVNWEKVQELFLSK
ncbi:MAG TPA: superoxide dismutase [Bacteroidia bacterium]|nr:superoxide dismutase [Bacteroidia bacterium]